MNHKEKTVITIESYSRTTMYLRRATNIARCERCAEETLMISPNEAAAVLQISAREIFRLTEANEIHYLETESGALFVCRRSLEKLGQIKE